MNEELVRLAAEARRDYLSEKKYHCDFCGRSFIKESDTDEIFTPSNHSLPDSYPIYQRFSVDLHCLGKGHLFYVRNSK